MNISIVPCSSETHDGREAVGKIVVIELFGCLIELGLMRVK